MAHSARSIKIELDEDEQITTSGGSVLIEKTMRGLGIRKLLGNLPSRERDAGYSSQEIGYQMLAGLLCGGKGFGCTQMLNEDQQLAQIFGAQQGVAEDSTIWRACCDFAGLSIRKFSELYCEAGRRLDAMDLFGQIKRRPAHRRIVPAEPEPMTPENKQSMNKLLGAIGLRCAKALNIRELSLAGFFPIHADATDLEVNGVCFQGAKRNHEGNVSLRMMAVKAGAVYCAVDVLAGASDEANNLPDLLKRADDQVISKVHGSLPVMALLDSAYAEKGVVEQCRSLGWLHVIGANQWRNTLERLAQEGAPDTWRDSGADEARGWGESQTAVFRHLPEGWEQVQIVVARRWREQEDLPGIWHYAFLYTDIDSSILPKKLLKQHGYANLIWMMYGTKQGHENFFKTALSDLDGHHPRSGRLGATQVFSLFTAMAANISAVMSLKVMPKEEKGIRLWRLQRDYFTMAARVVMAAGRTLVVKIAGKGLPRQRKLILLQAFAAAGRL